MSNDGIGESSSAFTISETGMRHDSTDGLSNLETVNHSDKEVCTDKRLSSAGSGRFSLLRDSDNSFLPPCAMADLLEDEFLTPVAKSTQIHGETPGGRDTKSALDGDTAGLISPPEGIRGSAVESDNLANISTGDRIITKSPDIIACAYTPVTSNKDVIRDRNRLSETEVELLDDISGKGTDTEKKGGDAVEDSRTSAGATDSRTHSEVTDNITAADWSRGRGLAIRTSTGPVQVGNFQTVLNGKCIAYFTIIKTIKHLRYLV